MPNTSSTYRTYVRLVLRYMEPWQIENLRRSVVMLSPGTSAGALTREQALALFDELADLEQQTARYQDLVEQIRGLHR